MSESTITPAELVEWKRLCESATPGPWRWRGITTGQHLSLRSMRGFGDIVMDFVRWGTQSAIPRFNVDGIMEKAALVIGISHHPWEITDVDHPDAQFIAASRNALPRLLAEVEERRLRARIASDHLRLAFVSMSNPSLAREHLGKALALLAETEVAREEVE